MLKHCRPDILARGHLSLLHRHHGKTLLSSASFVDTGVQIEYKYNIDKLLQTKNKICKFVYQNMVNNITEKPQNVFDKWDSYFKQDLKYEEWVESFCSMYKCNKSIE